MPTKNKTAPKPQTTYLLELKGGNLRRVTVPADWRLTFGPTTPYVKKERNGGYDSSNECWALRFYDDSKNVRAIFTDVKAYHDESIQILERVTKVQRKASQRETPKGMKDCVIEARVTEWVKPGGEDDDGENPFLLEAKKRDDDNPF